VRLSGRLGGEGELCYGRLAFRGTEQSNALRPARGRGLAVAAATVVSVAPGKVLTGAAHPQQCRALYAGIG
jgi:hypothetical protein